MPNANRFSIGAIQFRGFVFLVILLTCGSVATGFDYHVGEGEAYANIGDVPWESLGQGDTIWIHWRAEPYREKWVIGRGGASWAPITVRGVAGPGGALPVIDGDGATTRLQLDYWNESRGLIKIGGSSVPPETVPAHIVIENLDLRRARPPFTFTDHAGNVQSYANNAAAVYVEKANNVTIRNCILHDCGNGIFIGPGAGIPSSDFLIEGNSIYDNSMVGRIFEHNTYTAARRITYQYNWFGPTKSGAGGNNLKDRSAGLVVRYNWIEGGNRQLDLVDAEDNLLLTFDPLYRSTYVYGNVLIEPDGAGNRQIVHYGGDSGNTSIYRKGTLYMYHNTIVSTRVGRTTLMRLSTNAETCDFRNNVVYVTDAGEELSLLDADGVLALSHNWFKPGWVDSHGTLTGTIFDDGSSMFGASPGFLDEGQQDFRLDASSSCIDAGTALPPSVLGSHHVFSEYVKHQDGRGRVMSGAAMDIGAFEYFEALAADSDEDGDVDLTDFNVFAACFNMAGNPPRTFGCSSVLGERFDFDDDGDVDGIDYSSFSSCFNGAGNPPRTLGCPQ